MDNNYKPDLNFDAFTAGIDEGGLRSSSSVCVLVCYIVARSGEKVTGDTVIKALTDGGIANYFEVSSAVAKMIKTGSIKECDDKSLETTEKGKFNVDMLENDLPITVREKAVFLVAKLAKKEIDKKENKATVEKSENQYKVTLHVSDKDCDFMTLSLYFPSKAQAEIVKEKFLVHPAEVYENLINSIFSEEQENGK